MCDCYMHKCMYCDNEISMHIGDFSTDRDNVRVICPECLLRGMVMPVLKPDGDTPWMSVAVEDIKHDQQVIRPNGTSITDGVVAIFCCDKDAYGINLN